MPMGRRRSRRRGRRGLDLLVKIGWMFEESDLQISATQNHATPRCSGQLLLYLFIKADMTRCGTAIAIPPRIASLRRPTRSRNMRIGIPPTSWKTLIIPDRISEVSLSWPRASKNVGA
jgi:hypothetical protein